MTFFLYLISFIIAVFVVVLFHEFGHFVVARLFRVRVGRFSIGFGKALYAWKGRNKFTEYRVAPFLLGGYVKLLDTRETKVPKKYQRFAFDQQTAFKRFMIILAGPVANIIFAFFAFWLMLVIGFKLPKPVIGKVIPDSIASQAGVRAGGEIIQVDNRSTENWSEVVIAMLNRVGDQGKLVFTTKNNLKSYKLNLKKWRLDEHNPDPLLDFGLIRYEPFILPVIYRVVAGSPASEGGLQVGDRIVKISGKKISGWRELIEEIKLYPDQKVKLLVKRGKRRLNLKIDFGSRFGKGWKREGFLGIGFDKEKVIWPEEMLNQYKYGFWSALFAAKRQMSLFLDLNKIILVKLFTGKISLSVLGGPISVFSASGKALEQGFVMFLGFLAMISLTIAIVNLLPIPGLDGGHLIFILTPIFTFKKSP